MLPLFSITIFLGAALLFLIQPMVARLILPQLGGSPAVWNSCLVFFQTALLAGYLYAHGLGRARNQRAAVGLHGLALLAPITLLPLHLPRGHANLMESHPAAWLLLMLTLGIAAPFVMMSTGASLLQRWFAASPHPKAKDPYFLYAASNAGSLIGLLAYPLLIEPTCTLTQQRWLWSGGYILWAALVMACALISLRANTATESPLPAAPATPPPAASTRITWLLLALAPSSLLMGITTYLTTDLAAVPLLWVLPLSIYLITFIIAFSPPCQILITPSCWLFLLLAGSLAAFWLGGVRLPLPASFALHLSILLTGGIACHGRLAAARPATTRLTEFYLIMSLGGALGGVFNALLAPVLFSIPAEYPLAIGLVCALTFPSLRWPASTRLGIGAAAGALIAAALLWPLLQPGPGRRLVYRERTFYGIHRVIDRDDGWRELTHGVTIHGRERTDAANQGKPTGYYHHTGPLGQVMLLKRDDQRWRDTAIVGLGAGSLAAYGLDPAQHITFYEIDPAVIRIAGDKSMFTFISRCRAKVSAILGDARQTLSREPDARFDLIILDAFSSDAIPVHLITREAIALYLSKLAPGGVIALHISNRNLDLAPVLAAAARDLGLAARIRRDPAPARSSPLFSEGKSGSTVVILSKREENFGVLATDLAWQPLAPTPGFHVWTDDYSNILSVLDLR